MSAPQDDANLPITNTLFPPPPAYYKAFTEANLQRYEFLASSTEAGPSRPRATPPVPVGMTTGDSQVNLHAMTSEEEADLAELRVQLEKPRADWVKEDGRWMCFGQMYSVRLSQHHRSRPVLLVCWEDDFGHNVAKH